MLQVWLPWVSLPDWYLWDASKSKDYLVGGGGGGQWNLSLILNIITDNFSQLEMCTCVTLGTVGSNQEDSQELIGSLQTKTGEWYFFSVFKILVQLFMYSYWVSNPPAPSPPFSSSPVLAFTTQVSLWLGCHQLQGRVRSGHSTLRAVLHAVEVAQNNPCGQTGKIFRCITRTVEVDYFLSEVLILLFAADCFTLAWGDLHQIIHFWSCQLHRLTGSKMN